MSTTSSQVPPAADGERQASQAQRTQEAKTAFIASFKSVSGPLDNELQERAKNIHSNQEALTKQEKDLQKQTKDLAKETDSMEKFVAKSSKQLASLPEFDSLTADLDRDLAELEDLLNDVERDAGARAETER